MGAALPAWENPIVVSTNAPECRFDVTRDVVCRSPWHDAVNDLFRIEYERLRVCAARLLRREPCGATLQATAVVHEVWLRLRSGPVQDLRNPDARRGLLATMVRHVLVDRARSRICRHHHWRRFARTREWTALQHSPTGAAAIIDLDDSLNALRAIHERRARVAELRLFGGLTQPEIAECVGVSLATVELDWRLASHWLRKRLGP